MQYAKSFCYAKLKLGIWNELPTEIMDAPTVPAFASGLNKFYAFN